jgi:hypothetical protein
MNDHVKDISQEGVLQNWISLDDITNENLPSSFLRNIKSQIVFPIHKNMVRHFTGKKYISSHLEPTAKRAVTFYDSNLSQIVTAKALSHDVEDFDKEILDDIFHNPLFLNNTGKESESTSKAIQFYQLFCDALHKNKQISYLTSRGYISSDFSKEQKYQVYSRNCATLELGILQLNPILSIPDILPAFTSGIKASDQDNNFEKEEDFNFKYQLEDYQRIMNKRSKGREGMFMKRIKQRSCNSPTRYAQKRLDMFIQNNLKCAKRIVSGFSDFEESLLSFDFVNKEEVKQFFDFSSERAELYLQSKREI